MPSEYEILQEFEGVAWDCNLFFRPENIDYDVDIDEESDDWQILALDRFADRTIRGNY